MAVKREKVVKKAEKLVQKGKIEAAIKEYRQILAENPNDANTLNRVGDLYARLEKFDEAVKLFSQIAEQYSRDGFFVKAIAIYKKIIKLTPQSLTVYERLAELYHRQGLLNEARTQYQVLADHYEKRENYTSAANIYTRMSEMDPDNPSYYLKLAQIYQKHQLSDKAIKAYQQLANLFLVDGRIEEATQVYVTALDTYASDITFVREVAGGLFEEGHIEAATKVLEKAARINPDAEAVAQEIFGEPEAAPEPEPAVEPPPKRHLEVPEIDLDLTEPEPVAPEPFAAPPEAPEPSPFADAEGFEPGEGGADFTFDFEDEDVPSTQVAPPADMVDGEEASPFAQAEAAADEAVRAFQDEAGDGTEFSVDWEVADEASPSAAVEEEFEIELEESSAMLLEAPEVEAAPPPPAAPPRHEEDLLAEAKVFAKYGLREKAEDRLQELLRGRSEHLGALCLMAELDLDAGRHDTAVEWANKAGQAAASASELAPWQDLREKFAQAGFELADDHVTGEPEPKEDRIGRLLEDLDESAAGLSLQDVAEPEPAEPELPEPEMAELEGLEPIREPEMPEIEFPDLEPVAADLDLEVPDTVEPGKVTVSMPAMPMETGADETILVTPESAEEDIFGDDSTVSAGTPAETPAEAPPEPEGPSELEALMQSVTGASGFEELGADASLADLGLGDLLDEEPEEPAAPPPAAAPNDQVVSLVDELGLDGMEGFDLPAEEEGPAAAAAPAPLDETGMSWLDEVSTPEPEAAAQAESIFDEEDDFFNLAAELEAEMGADADTAEPPAEQSLQDIIDGFKQGVAENLSSEDYDTHFNLGIAYREMGLLDEAIGEFQLSAKDPRHIVESSSMLGICFLDKGLPELAVRWYRKGLEAPGINEDQTLGLLYDMAEAYLHQSDVESAYRTFVEIYGINSNYRDVAARIQELAETPAS